MAKIFLPKGIQGMFNDFYNKLVNTKQNQVDFTDLELKIKDYIYPLEIVILTGLELL
jgi:hypothetical protein